MDKQDFCITKDTIYWSVVLILIVSIFCSWHLGVMYQEHRSRIEWLEDAALGTNQPIKGGEYAVRIEER